MGEAGCYLYQLRKETPSILTECSIMDFLSVIFHFLKVHDFTLIQNIYYYPTCFIPRDHENKIRPKKKERFFIDQMTMKTRNKNKGQNKQLTNLLIRELHLFNGFNIFPYLSRDITVFPFLSFIFSSESQVHSNCFLLLSLETFLSVWQSFVFAHD